MPRKKPVRDEKTEYLFACDIDHPSNCDGSKCHKCGFNPVERERRKYIMNKDGLSTVKKIHGVEIKGLKVGNND